MNNLFHNFYAWCIVSVCALIAVGFVIVIRYDFLPSRVSKSPVEIAAELTDKLLRASEEYKEATTEQEKQQKLQEAVSAAEERKTAILALIETNPDLIGEVAVDREKQKELPQEVKNLLEQAVALEGDLEVTHGDGPEFEPELSTFQHTLIVDDDRYALFSDKPIPGVLSNSKVRASGFALDEKLGVVSGGLEILQPALPGHTVKKVAVILINFRNNTSQPLTQEQVRNVIYTSPKSVNAFYQEASFGNLRLTGIRRPDVDVFGWYTIDSDNTGCQAITSFRNRTGYKYEREWTILGEEAAVQGDNVDINAYDNVIYVFNDTDGCLFGGRASLLGRKSWIAEAVYFKFKFVAHELGHNFGSKHAKAITCTDAGGQPVPVSEHCIVYEYGDPFDVMGGGPQDKHLNNFNKGRLNWFLPSNTREVITSGVYTLAPVEQRTDAVQALRIPRLPLYPEGIELPEDGASPAYYYLEYRQPYGFDNFQTTDPVVNGISLRIAEFYEYPDAVWSHLIDTTPHALTGAPGSVSNDLEDSALRIGNVFTDEESGIRVVPVNFSNAAATARVEFISPNIMRVNRDLFFDDMEHGQNGWVARGLWHQSTRRSFSSNSSWYFGQESAGNYVGAPSTRNFLTSPPIDISGKSGLWLEFDYYLEREPGLVYDRPYVVISGQGANNASFSGSLADTLRDTGGTWKHMRFSIDDRFSYLYPPSGPISIQVGFNFENIDSANNNFEGWYVDNVKVVQEETRGALSLIEQGSGELNAGGTRMVSWTSRDISPDVSMKISIGNVQTGAKWIVLQSTPNDGAEEVTVPVNIPSGDSYELVIEAGCSQENTPCLVGDRSNRPYSVVTDSDLVITSGPTVKGGSLIGKTPISFGGVVRNSGHAPVSESFTARFQVDRNNDGSVDETLGDVVVTGLGVGEEKEVVSSAVSTIPAGSHRIVLCIDPANTIREESETNNCSADGAGLITLREYTGTVSVVSPGTLYRGGSANVNLSFSSDAQFPQLDLVLYKGSTKLGVLTGEFLSRASFKWNVGEHSRGSRTTTAPVGRYSLKVMLPGSNTVLAQSSEFTIATPPPPSIGSFKISPVTVSSGGHVTVTYVGANVSSYKFFLNCPIGVSAKNPLSSAVNDYCNIEVAVPSNQRLNSFVLEFTSTSSKIQRVVATLKAVNLAGTTKVVKNATIDVRR